MSRRKQLIIIAVAALMVSVSLLGGVELSTVEASGTSLKNLTANASHGAKSEQKNPFSISVGNASPSDVQTNRVGVSAASSAPSKPVTAATTPTTLTITTSNANPAVSQSFTLKGTLKAGSTPLSGKKITLLRKDPTGVWTYLGTNTTATDGSYRFTRSESSTGTYHYQVNSQSDALYATSLTGCDVVLRAA